MAETPPGSPQRPSLLNNLGSGLRDRFARSGRVEDLEEAIRVYQAAVAETPSGAPDRPMFLNNCGNGLRDRFARRGRGEDLEEAIRVYQVAVAETPPGSPDRHSILNNWGTGLGDRFARSGRGEDLEEAIRVYQAAVAETPPGAPDRPVYLNNLGIGLSDRFARSGRVEDLEEATTAYRAACEQGLIAAPEATLRAGRNWGRWALTRTGPSFDEAAVAYGHALDAIDNLFGVQLNRAAQESWLKEAQGLHTAAAYALARQARFARFSETWQIWLRQAVETVERGQARLLAQALEENRADLARLAEVGQAKLYADYQANLTRRTALLSQLEAAPDGLSRSAANAALRANKDERDRLIERMRGVPGYEDFLARPSFARIAAALPHPSPPHIGEGADGGTPAADSPSIRPATNSSPGMDGEALSSASTPINSSPGTGEAGRGFLVYLLATPAGGLALVVHSDGGAQTADGGAGATVTPVWLDGLTEAWLRELVYGPADDPALGGYLGAYDRSLRQRTAAARQGWFVALDATCRQLWDVAMAPLANALTVLAGRPQAGRPQRDAPTQSPNLPIANLPSPLPVTLIPTGLLGLLPLHAVWTPIATDLSTAPSPSAPAGGGLGRGRRYFLDDFAVNYAASAISLGHSQTRAVRAAAERLLAVAEPLPVAGSPLPDARREVAAIAELFPPAPVLAGGDATRAALLAGLPHADVFHFSGHGSTAWGNPLESTLWCAHNEPLTVRDILALRLPGARLAVLSACETGIPGRELPDETVNLPSALVQAGFAGAVASLWSVYDISTAMLLVRFYQHWRVDGQQPVHALRAAQLWLRDTTNREKAAFFGQFVPGLQQRMAGQVGAEFFVALHNREEGLDDHSFAHPVHWAAFTLTGV